MKQCIIVTGSSRGIGRAVVNELKSRGRYVVSLSRGDGLTAEVMGQELRLGFDWKAFDALPGFIAKQIGSFQVDGLVNNAGMLRSSDLLEATYDDFVEHMKVNAWYPLELFKTLYREGVFGSKSHVLNIGSMGGIQGASKFPGLFNYSASKAALASLTEAMAAEIKGEGLTFNYLALGAVNTEMLKEAFPGYSAPVNPENMAKLIASVLLDSGGIMNGRLIQATNSDPEG
jgi:short-subunit dehydrogenase